MPSKGVIDVLSFILFWSLVMALWIGLYALLGPVIFWTVFILDSIYIVSRRKRGNYYA